MFSPFLSAPFLNFFITIKLDPAEFRLNVFHPPDAGPTPSLGNAVAEYNNKFKMKKKKRFFLFSIKLGFCKFEHCNGSVCSRELPGSNVW